jgi:hypothetical protein
MKLKRFFIIYPCMFLLELTFLGIINHPTILLTQLTALTAIVLYQLPWYLHAYTLIAVSLSSFIQGFSVPFNLLGIMLVIFAMTTYIHTILVRNSIAQGMIIAFLTLSFTALNCFSCLTICNILITILIIPLMIQFLR